MKQLNKNFEIKISKKFVTYENALLFMKKRVQAIIDKKEKELIWFLNHDHIYTCGTSSKKSEILYKTNIPIVNTNRGGKITYHGPGQRIVYLIIDLNKRKKDVRKFTNIIEDTVICLLKNLSIDSTSYSDRIGIWVTKINGKLLPRERKIGAIGLRIKKWITYHGLSFNINNNLAYYNNIKPCGLSNYSVTSLQDLGINISQKDFDKNFIKIFNKKLKSF